MKKTFEAQRRNTTPRQFFRYCEQRAEEKGFCLADWIEFDEWQKPTKEENSYTTRDDNGHIKSIIKHLSFDAQMYQADDFNFIIEFDFTDENHGNGYCFIMQEENDPEPKPEPKPKNEHRSTRKETRQAIRQYIISCVNLEDYGIDQRELSPLGKIRKVYEIFQTEKSDELARYGKYYAFKSWQFGLCSALPCYDCTESSKTYLAQWLGDDWAGLERLDESEADSYFIQLITREFFALLED